MRYAAGICVLPLLVAACSEGDRDNYQGYAEGEFVRVAAPFAGRLQSLSVARGMQVKTGAALFVLEQENEAAARREAQERLKNAEAQLADLQKGKRPTEIEAVQAQLAQADAALKLSQAQLTRAEELVTQHFMSKDRLDEVRSAHDRDSQRVAELKAQLATARLSARPDEIRAAESNMKAAKAALDQADWRLAQKTVQSPVAGLVQDTYYVIGEWVNAGAPLVSLLPPQNIKLRFFVEERRLGAVRIGQAVAITCDGCPAPVAATVSYISPQAEFTPPVIYSREQRAKLVFLIEARPSPEDAVRLHPGQPVEVKFEVSGKQ